MNNNQQKENWLNHNGQQIKSITKINKKLAWERYLEKESQERKKESCEGVSQERLSLEIAWERGVVVTERKRESYGDGRGIMI